MTQTAKKKKWKGILRRLVSETAGQEIAEAAAVLPLMFLVLLGIFWFGQAFSIYGTAARAAHEAALAAAETPCTTCAAGSTPPVQNAYNTIQKVLSTASMSVNSLHKPVPPPGFLLCHGGVAVPCDGTHGNVCIQPNVQLSSPGGGAVGVCGVSVSFTYQYQMWLPFTSLNNQAIQIRAAAQAPLESR